MRKDKFELIDGREALAAHLPDSPDLVEMLTSWRGDRALYLPPREAVHKPITKNTLHPTLALYVRMKYGEKGPWLHQTLAVEEGIGKGHNTITTTGTGSGKSLIFMLQAFDALLKNKEHRSIVFFPFKALSQDQTQKWHDLAKTLRFDPSTVAKIDGSVPIAERMELLQKARIVLMTPDVVHKWMLGNLAEPEIQKFVKNLRYRFLDEAHMYDGIFGTNMLYMMRRLDYHQVRLNPAMKFNTHGASGTLQDAVGFFSKLTGQNCVHISEEMDGAPRARKIVQKKAGEWWSASEILARADLKKHQAVIFSDSRRKVEEMADKFKQHLVHDDKASGANVDDMVLSYKAGLPPEEFERLHHLIKNQTARAVFATSALEAGVDLDFTIGLNIDFPLRKSDLLQRMGRVGRREDAVFIIAGEGGYMGITSNEELLDYLNNAEMETPVLYENNRSLQIAAASCFIHEINAVKKSYAAKSDVKERMQWPRGFTKIYQDLLAKDLKLEPHEFGLIVPYGSRPHSYFALRTIPSERFRLTLHSTGKPQKSMGDVSAMSALMEFTPGLITRHMGRKVRVQRWIEGNKGSSEIILTPYKGENTTFISTFVKANIGIEERRIIGAGGFRRHMLEHPIDGGFITHIQGTVTTSVLGFREMRKDDGKWHMVRPYKYYDDFQLEKVKEIKDKELIDYGPPRHVENRTSGVLVHIPEKWFGKDARELLAKDILHAYCHRNRISPQDVAVMYKNINFFWGEDQHTKDNSIYFYETSGAQVGLLKDLPSQFRQILLHLKDELIEDGFDKYKRRILDSMLRFSTGLTTAKSGELAQIFNDVVDIEQLDLPASMMAVFSPKSHVKTKSGKTMQRQVEIVLPVVKEYKDPDTEEIKVIPGYLIKEVDRKKFYSSGRWITVSKTGNLYDGIIQDMKRSEANTDDFLRNHFIPASRIATPLLRAEMAMDQKSGKLYSIAKEERGVELNEYKVAGDKALLKKGLGT